MSTIENVLWIALLSAMLIALIAFVIVFVSHKLRDWDERMLVRQKQQARVRHMETMTRKPSVNPNTGDDSVFSYPQRMR